MITRSLIGIIAALVSVQAPAQDKPDLRDVAAIVQCLKRADAKGGNQKSCLALVSTPCLEDDKNTIPDMVRCHDREFLAWHDILARTVQRLRMKMNDEQRAKLRSMQDAWTTSLRRSCRFYEDYSEGSIVGPLAAECAANETGRRVLFLLFFLKDASFLDGSDGN